MDRPRLSAGAAFTWNVADLWLPFVAVAGTAAPVPEPAGSTSEAKTTAAPARCRWGRSMIGAPSVVSRSAGLPPAAGQRVLSV
jgi:hypothetical protein